MYSLLLLASAAVPALADTHYFFAGSFAGTTVVGVEFDDATSTLTLVNNITTSASGGSKWINIDVSRQNENRLCVETSWLMKI